MPISPEFVTQLAGQVLAYAGSCEVRVVAATANALGGDPGRPEWAREKLAGLRALQETLLGIASRFVPLMEMSAQQAMQKAGAAGQRAALDELHAALEHLEPQLPGLRSLIELAAANLDPLTDGTATTGILRSATDAYRAVVAEATSGVVAGAQTRRQAAQRALDRWALRGITAFRDSRGRQWDLASYAEMATRAASQRAMVAAHNATLQSNGVDLVIVSNAPQECERCRPFEGRVLALTGGSGRQQVRAENPATGNYVLVDVYDSLSGAQAKGFMHPGCRHSLGAYLPGVTEPHAGPTADPEGDAARRRLRELERRVRAARRLEAAALDEPARKAASARVRAQQAAIREHLKTEAGSKLQRQPARERIGAAR